MARIRPDFADIILAYGSGEDAVRIAIRFSCSRQYVTTLVSRYGHGFGVAVAPWGGKRGGSGRRRANGIDRGLIAMSKIDRSAPRPLTLPSIRGWTP